MKIKVRVETKMINECCKQTFCSDQKCSCERCSHENAHIRDVCMGICFVMHKWGISELKIKGPGCLGKFAHSER